MEGTNIAIEGMCESAQTMSWGMSVFVTGREGWGFQDEPAHEVLYTCERRMVWLQLARRRAAHASFGSDGGRGLLMEYRRTGARTHRENRQDQLDQKSAGYDDTGSAFG